MHLCVLVIELSAKDILKSQNFNLTPNCVDHDMHFSTCDIIVLELDKRRNVNILSQIKEFFLS